VVTGYRWQRGELVFAYRLTGGTQVVSGAATAQPDV
jgi:hypothetical protein